MISNPQIVRFTNERARVLADALATAYFTSKKVLAEYYADPDMGAALIADMAGVVADGATEDGRPVATANDVLAIITRASEFVADMEAGGSAKLNTVLALAVNGTSKV